MSNEFLVFAGTGNEPLAATIAHELKLRLAPCQVERFPDGEVAVRLLAPVRRKEIFIVQPTSPPVNENLVELLALVDACRRSCAARITAVVPYFGYTRSDNRHDRREPIMASLVAACLQCTGMDHLITLDLHAPPIEGFFHVPVDSLSAVPALWEALGNRLAAGTVIVAPDAGAVKMAGRTARHFGAPIAVLHTERQTGAETTVHYITGDVRDRPCLIVDDMIATEGTMAATVEALLEAGARPEIRAAAVTVSCCPARANDSPLCARSTSPTASHSPTSAGRSCASFPWHRSWRERSPAR
jgi:ribose-phosphate pyrophosphokinase